MQCAMSRVFARLPRTSRPACGVAREASGSSDGRFYEPGPRAFGKEEVDMVIALVQNNVSNEVIDLVLQGLVMKAVEPLMHRNALLEKLLGELNTELEKLRGKLNTAIERGEKEVARRDEEVARRDEEVARRDEEIARLRGELNLITAQYLNSQGLLNMRGLMEYIQETMHTRTNVQWDKAKPIDCWRAYLDERKSLLECLKNNNVNLKYAPEAMAQMYTTLTKAVHNSLSPDEFNKTKTKLEIGLPLENWRQRAMMVCLCKDMNVGYTYRT